jgi:hypothetical protein
MTRQRATADAAVVAEVARAASRLRLLAGVMRHLGAGGRAFATAVDALRQGFSLPPQDFSPGA